MNEDIRYFVVISEDGRYSIWPVARPLPWGWMPEGTEGDRTTCLDHIGRVWTEFHPGGEAGPA